MTRCGRVDAMKIASSYVANVLAKATPEVLQVKFQVIELASIGHVYFVATSNSFVVFSKKVLLDTRDPTYNAREEVRKHLRIKTKTLIQVPLRLQHLLGALSNL